MPSSEVLRLPDLIGLCPFPVSSNPHCAQAGVESAAWIERYNVFSERNRSFFLQLCGERLVSRAYPYADFESARTCCDFMNLVFVLDEISDDQDGAGARETGDTFLKAMSDEPCDGSLLSRITKDFKKRLTSKARPNCQRRFVQHCASYLQAVSFEADLRERGQILDLEAYTAVRRENSGARPSFALFEYTLGIDLPDEVFEDPVFESLNVAAVDMIFWSNDLYSYNVEQAKGIAGNNVITVIMKAHRLSIQEAFDFVGLKFRSLLEQFLVDKSRLRPFGLHIDPSVRQFVIALEHWIIGNLVWSFETQRYFGPQHEEIRRSLTVRLAESTACCDDFVIEGDASGN